METEAMRMCALLVDLLDVRVTELVDLSLFGDPTRLVWHKHRWACVHGTLRVRRSLSRPRVPNDNPHAEAGFKTLKYQAPPKEPSNLARTFQHP